MLKLPKIVDNGLEIKKSRGDSPYMSSFGMSFVTSDNKQVSPFSSCRDYMHDQIRTFVNDKKRVGGDGHNYYPIKGDPDIFMDRLRLLISFEKKHNEKNNGFDKIREALRALNTIEKYADMELTVGESVNVVNKYGKYTDKDCYLVLLRGSGEYMKNPHLLSALTLVLRFIYMNDLSIKFRKEDDLKRLYNKLRNRGGKNYPIMPFKDQNIMIACHKHLHLILKERKELFKDKSLKELFPTGINDFHSKGGINNLCMGKSPNGDVNEKVKSIVNEK